MVRATTARLCTPAGGRATRELKLALPSELCCVGLRPTEFVTFAPFNVPALRRVPARVMRWPLVKAEREAVVTARGLCAFTKLTLRILLLKMFRLRINVL